jgi:hypothetical protein
MTGLTDRHPSNSEPVDDDCADNARITYSRKPARDCL